MEGRGLVNTQVSFRVVKKRKKNHIVGQPFVYVDNPQRWKLFPCQRIVGTLETFNRKKRGRGRKKGSFWFFQQQYQLLNGRFRLDDYHSLTPVWCRGQIKSFWTGDKHLRDHPESQLVIFNLLSSGEGKRTWVVREQTLRQTSMEPFTKKKKGFDRSFGFSPQSPSIQNRIRGRQGEK